VTHRAHRFLGLKNSNFCLIVLVLMKLSRAANLSPSSRVKTIFLPSSTNIQINPNSPHSTASNNKNDLYDRNENYLRKLEPNVGNLVDLIAQVNQKEIKKRQPSVQAKLRSSDDARNETKVIKSKKHRRRNDKFLHRRLASPNDEYLMNPVKFASSSIDYFDCVAVGWGKYRNSGDLSDILLKIEVPIQSIKR
jgi:hypothetical protein